MGWVILTSLLWACTPSNPALVRELSASQAVKAKQLASTTSSASKTHRVKKGETLFTIAKKNKTSVHAIAKANRLRAPYTIYPGQTLTIIGQTKTAGLSKPKQLWHWMTSQKRVLSSFPNKFAKKSALGEVTQTKVIAPKNSSQVVAKTKTATPSPKPKVQVPVPKPRVATASTRQSQASPNWSWPVRGKVLQNFGASQPNRHTNKGLDIAGKEGQPVRAAADGEVVYSGNALRGYGNLIIIKHDEKFLTAYAHNRKIIVKESERIKKGQMIAEMGKTGTDHVHLHFEVRYHGKPVDPLTVLPKS